MLLVQKIQRSVGQIERAYTLLNRCDVRCSSQTKMMCVSSAVLALCITAVVTAQQPDDGHDDGRYFRPPSIPFATFGPMQQKHVLATETASPIYTLGKSTEYWLGQPMPIGVAVRFGDRVVPLLGGDQWPTIPSTPDNNLLKFWAAEQQGPADAGPLITRLEYGIYEIHVLQKLLPALTECVKGGVKKLRGCAEENGGNTSQTLRANVTIETIHTMIPTDLDLLTRPLVYLRTAVTRVALEANNTVSFYVDFAAQNAIHLYETANTSEPVSWVTGSVPVDSASAISYASLGTTAQPAFKTFGDLFMLDWGHTYLGVVSTSGVVTDATAGHDQNSTRKFFNVNGTLPRPNMEQHSLPAISNATNTPITTAVLAQLDESASEALFLLGYSTPHIMDYFGDKIFARWAKNGTVTSFTEVLHDAVANATTTIAACRALQVALQLEWTLAFGGRYSKIASLAYRQTFAAIETGYSRGFDEDVAFLKEISTDGDINTMDVIFPASPLFLWSNPTILKQLLIPVLRFATNMTKNNYSKPYSPHQLGIYPLANATTASQEVMPLENSGNMLILLLAYAQRVPSDPFFFTPMNASQQYNPFWGVLSYWVDYMVDTQLPDPPRQVYTDDFAGPLGHCTNLAAKGIIAVKAFGELCSMVTADDVNPVNGRPCSWYMNKAAEFATFWVDHATEVDQATGLQFTRLAYDQNYTWSTKYNLVWQRLLNGNVSDPSFVGGPFYTLSDIARNEVNWYRIRSNYYGYPIDVRHSYQKLDWLTWGAALCESKPCFNGFFDGVYRMANQTANRNPLTDLYNTHHATIVFNFVARPVVGAVFMPLMLRWKD
jgi:hypothetical protein